MNADRDRDPPSSSSPSEACYRLVCFCVCTHTPICKHEYTLRIRMMPLTIRTPQYMNTHTPFFLKTKKICFLSGYLYTGGEDP